MVRVYTTSTRIVSRPIRPTASNRLPHAAINPHQASRPYSGVRGHVSEGRAGRRARRGGARGLRLFRDAVPAHETPAAVAAGGAHLLAPVLGAGEAAAGALAPAPQTVRVAPGVVHRRVAPLLAPVDAARRRARLVARRQRRVWRVLRQRPERRSRRRRRWKEEWREREEDDGEYGSVHGSLVLLLTEALAVDVEFMGG